MHTHTWPSCFVPSQSSIGPHRPERGDLLKQRHHVVLRHARIYVTMGSPMSTSQRFSQSSQRSSGFSQISSNIRPSQWTTLSAVPPLLLRLSRGKQWHYTPCLHYAAMFVREQPYHAERGHRQLFVPSENQTAGARNLFTAATVGIQTCNCKCKEMFYPWPRVHVVISLICSCETEN